MAVRDATCFDGNKIYNFFKIPRILLVPYMGDLIGGAD